MAKYGFAIDRGGTFTDVYVRRPNGASRVLKLLSEDPGSYNDAPTEGIRRVLEEVGAGLRGRESWWKAAGPGRGPRVGDRPPSYQPLDPGDSHPD